MIIENFSFNTTNGKTIILTNKSVEEIADELHKMFPQWSIEVCNKFANNSNFYHVVVPIHKEEKKKKTYTKFKTPILVNNIAINDLLRLGASLLAYHKNGYRQWGVCVNEIFDDWKITPTWNTFEREYEYLVRGIKNNSLETTDIWNKTTKMCKNLLELSKVIKSSGMLKEDEEFIHGATDGRRLGLQELMNRADDMANLMLTKL